jgi:hypothetical protein
MEESGEQCTVVFALIVTEPGSECVQVHVCAEGGGCCTPHPQADYVTTYAKTTVHYPRGSSVIFLSADIYPK